MSRLDNILEVLPPKNAETTKRQIKELLYEVVEEVYTERRKAEARRDGYETGTRLVKRLLKKAVDEL
jgi:transposase